MTVIAWTASLGATLWTSHHEVLTVVVAAFAVLWPLYLWWPEIKLLRIAYPKNAAKLESPVWLYIIGIVSMAILSFAWYRVYSETSIAPRVLTADEFAQPYLANKFVKIADLADSRKTIEGRTFEGVTFYGPAVLYGKEWFDLGRNNEFDGSIDQIAQVMTPGTPLGAGVVVIKDVKFKDCRFFNISFVMTPEDKEKWKQEARIGPP